MKKTTITVLLAVLTMISYGQAFKAENSYVSLSYGLGYFTSIKSTYKDLTGYKGFSSGAIVAKYEYAINDNWGIGAGIGFSKFGFSYTYAPLPYKDKVTYSLTQIMGKLAYHFNVQNSKLDVYTFTGLGYTIWGFKWESDFPGFSKTSATVGVPLGFELGIGSRYFIKDNLGVFSEVGYTIGAFSVGAVYKLP